MSNVIIGGSATGATPLPTASTIDPVNDYVPIYTAGVTATQAINRNTYLGLTSAPVSINDVQTLTNKTLGITNIATLKDANFTLDQTTDNTKQLRFNLSAITSGNMRTLTIPDISDTITTLTATQTLTNKTLTTPTITSPTITNATLSADTITGYTTSNSGTIYGISVTSGTIGSAALANNSILNAAIATGNLYTSKIYNSCKFLAYRNAPYTTATPYIFDTKVYDTGNNYSVSTGEFTAPVNGYYCFTASTPVNVSGGIAIGTILFINGTAYFQNILVTTYTSAFTEGLPSTWPPIYMTAGQTAYIQPVASTQPAVVGNNPMSSYFGGYLFCAT